MWSKLTCTVILFAELSYMQTYPTCRVILLARITVQIIILLISHVLAANQLPHHMISPMFCPGWKNRCNLWNSNHQSSTFFFKAKIQGGHILLSKRFEGGEAHSLPPQTVHPINIVRQSENSASLEVQWAKLLVLTHVQPLLPNPLFL